MGVRRFEDLAAWRFSRALVRSVNCVCRTGGFRRDRDLRSQIRRAAVSVMSNIAEGFERGTDRDFRHFLYIAKGSCGEVRSQVYVAMDEGYLSEDAGSELIRDCEKVNRMIAGLIKHLDRSIPAPNNPQSRRSRDPS